MGIIRKSPGTVDFTLWQKRGLIKVPEIKSSGLRTTIDGFVDFRGTEGQTADATNNASTDVSSTSTSSASPFDFLSNLASTTPASSTPEANSPFPQSPQSDSFEVSALKIKIEDLEFKIERLVERIIEMESRMR